MKPLFQINAQDIDLLLPHMKERLMLQDEHSQSILIERISTFLKTKVESDREMIVAKLINSDIVSSLCDLLQPSGDRFVISVLDCLSLVSGYRKFYESHAAMDAVDSILKLAYCVTKSQKEGSQFLQRLVDDIQNMLHRAVNFGINLDSICVPQRILIFLRNLNVRSLSKNQLKFSVVALLNTTLEYSKFEEADETTISDVCREAISSMKEIVEYSDDEYSVFLAAAVLCNTCACGIRFCDDSEDEFESNKKPIIQRRIAFAKFIYIVILNTVIPYFKNGGRSETDLVTFHRNLVICLNGLYQVRNCNHNNLSNHLAANGYLKYFLRLAAEFPENLRRAACTLMKRVLCTLARRSLSIDKWPEGDGGFSNMLLRGLLGSPRDPDRWMDSLARDGDDSTALMILVYYHFHGTRETDMISLKSFITRATRLSTIQPVATAILKPLWFLFAVAWVSHSNPNSCQNYNNAIKRLTSILQQSELNEYYTHHIDLLRFIFKCGDITNDLRCKVMDLWLIESKGDIKPLLSLDCKKIVQRCLLIAVQTGYPESVISLAVKGIRELMRHENSREIAEIVWQLLPNVLSSYEPNKGEGVKAILELANITKPHQFSLSIINRCANSLVNIILTESADLSFEILAVTQAYVLLVASVTQRSSKVLERYVNDRKFLEKLYFHGFSRETSGLSVVCLKLLAFVIHCQAKFLTRCPAPMTVDIRSLFNLLIDTRKSSYIWVDTMRFLHELLSRGIDGSAVVVKKITSGIGEERDVINLYEILQVIHAKGDLDQRNVVYQCLSAVLKHCQRNVETLMYHLCTAMSNYDLVMGVTTRSYVSCHFLEFVVTWLRYRRRYCDDEGTWNSRSLFKTPFEETLDRLTKYAAGINDKGLEGVQRELRYALSLFDGQNG